MLIDLALEGNEEALEELTCRHRSWIHDTALGMTRDPQVAEDVTQDVLVIILTRLSTFRGESSFRCWLHRIISNHVINMMRKRAREACISFSQIGRLIDSAPFSDLSDPKSLPVDLPLLFEEAGVFRMMGMLLCLDSEQRMIFILGDLFEVNDWVGSRVFDISKVNYRKKLSRARKRVYGFVKEKYGSDDGKAARRFESNPTGKAPGRNGASRFFLRVNGNHGRRNFLFEEKYHRFNAYFHDQYRRLIEERATRNTLRNVMLFREIVNSDELKKLF